MTATHEKYLNRELSWLGFNQRVLEEALDASVPALERLKFLAITSSNLDEFFRVRVGGLQQLEARGATRRDASGLSPREQLDAIRDRVARMYAAQYHCFLHEIEPVLARAGLRRLQPDDLTSTQRTFARQVFDEQIYPILTPVAVADGSKFPLLPNLMLTLCVRLTPTSDETDSPPRFAVLPLGPNLPRFVSIPAERGYAYVLLEDLVTAFVGRFFEEQEVVECVPFRVTRNADISVQEDSASDLLEAMQNVLSQRNLAQCARLEIAETASTHSTQFLLDSLRISPERTFNVAGPLDLSAWFSLTDRPGFEDLTYEDWPPQPSPAAPRDRSLFEVIAAGDVLLCHPYESFEPVVRFIEEAAEDPEVMAIKQTLYRTSRNSPIVEALQRATEAGKHVTVVVELKARFDEARNIQWARRLEEAGAQVIYGVKGLKTHAKACLIIRREPHGIQRYVHFGTGNYNEATARIYSDISFFTVDPDLSADAVAFFNAVTGYSQPQKYRKIAAAPQGLRDRLLELIRTETARARDNRPARIIAKVNALVDARLIDALYKASQAGVRVQLNVRGICRLRPGVPGLSDNIDVVSIVDRFLEHARILYFHHGGDELMFISSADWMPRNLDRRIELLTPIEDVECRRRLKSILDTYFRDNVKARRLLPDGAHRAVDRSDDEPSRRAQQELYRRAVEAFDLAQRSRGTMFVPHRPDSD
ncbi:MAG: polyphosphate kinase 1 [Planctomycetota bacterium]|nr:MAG: polyphosphate kinase 1 [Planctomycetota bacterium]